jgi:hypothetical protein
VEYVDEMLARSVPRIAPSLAPKTSLWRSVHASTLAGAERAGIWFTAGMIALLIAAILFGAAITLYSRRAF